MPNPEELEMQKLLKEFLKRNPTGGEREIAIEFGVSRPTIERWRSGVNFPLLGMIPLVSSYLKMRIADMVIAEPTDIRVEVESEGGCTPGKARVTVYDGKKIVAVVTGKIEMEQGGDGGYYDCIKLKEEKGTFSCLLCGTTTTLPHLCPVFYPERSTPPT